MTLLGHVIRAGTRDRNDPMYQITFQGADLEPKTTTYRRVGRPRHKWHQETMTKAWQTMPHQTGSIPEYTGSKKQRKQIRAAAIDREGPFAKSKNEKKNKNR